jgi:titin
MKFRSVLVLLSLVAVLSLPLAAAAQTDAPPPAELAAPDAPAATFTVNTTSDSPSGTCGDGTCTLREAIIEANANGSSKDTINFNIAGDGPHIITLTAPLQAISQPVTINGLSEPGSACNGFPFTLKIVLNGSGLASGVGLTLTANGSSISGLVIQRFPSHGLEIKSSNNSLVCNYIGTNSAGTADLGNGGIGVYINNGGANQIRANVISGNDSFGIYVGGANAKDNDIQTNVIGLNATISGALGNGEEGILVQDASGTRIGASASNYISGNGGHGIAVSGNSPNTLIMQNYIGTNASGSAAVPNQGAGISVNSPGVQIGGPGGGNTISGNQSSGVILDKGNTLLQDNHIGISWNGNFKVPNGSYGVYVRSSNNKIGTAGSGNFIGGNGQDGVFVESGENNVIQGNYIGTNATLNSNLGNAMFGVHIFYGQNTLVGGATTNLGNYIAFNGADGVYIPNDASAGNRVNANSIYSNGDLGIDLGNSGVTPNDVDDPDTGPNLLQNFPTLSSVGSNGTATKLVGALNSKPNQTYRVEFFIAGSCDPSGYGEGRGYLGSTSVTTNGGGDAAISLVLPVGVGVGTDISATATDSAGNTSEFSKCRNAVFQNIPKPVFLPAVQR